MVVLAVLLIFLLLFRGIGALGIAALSSWKTATNCALAVMFTLTASAHFTRARYDLASMVPKSLPSPMSIIYFSGVCELAGALGILLTQFRSLAGICLVALMIAMFPANVKAAQDGLTLRGKPATPLRLRLPMQILFIGLTWWSTRP